MNDQPVTYAQSSCINETPEGSTDQRVVEAVTAMVGSCPILMTEATDDDSSDQHLEADVTGLGAFLPSTVSWRQLFPLHYFLLITCSAEQKLQSDPILLSTTTRSRQYKQYSFIFTFLESIR